MAPVEEPAAAPVHDYFAAPEPSAQALPEIAPLEETTVEQAEQLPEIQPIPLVAPAPVVAPAAELPTMAPPAPVEEPVELPTMAPPEPELELAAQPVEIALPVVESIAEEDRSIEELFAPKLITFRVVVRLKDSEGVEVGSFRDFGTAMEGAQEVIEQFSTATDGRWPFYAGRFIRPDLIVSVDVVEGDES